MFEWFIARRFMPRGRGEGFSGPLASIAVGSIALGVLVMAMAVGILRGFQADIADKVVGFGSHLTVRAWGPAAVGEELPIVADSALEARLRALPQVRHVQPFATKGGMVKTGDQIYGILLRGVPPDYDTTFFARCLVEGRLPGGTENGERRTENEVLISRTIASRLRLGVGDKMRTYFWQGQGYRARAFEVCGIYNSDLAEMDELYVLGSLRQVQRLNGDTTAIGGYEVLVHDFDRLDEAAEAVTAALPMDLTAVTVRQANPALFSWLELLETNIVLILTIMGIVCAVAIVSALLIMIFEKRQTIGLLKALGATGAELRRIFMLKSARLIVEGIALGDAAALLLSWVQGRWQVVRLDPTSYSMSHVPVEINWWAYAAISAATLVVCVAALLLPAAYISRISPAQTMRNG